MVQAEGMLTSHITLSSFYTEGLEVRCDQNRFPPIVFVSAVNDNEDTDVFHAKQLWTDPDEEIQYAMLEFDNSHAELANVIEAKNLWGMLDHENVVKANTWFQNPELRQSYLKVHWADMGRIAHYNREKE